MFIKDLKAFKEAVKDMEETRGISAETITNSLKDGIIMAYHKTHGQDQEIEVEIDSDFNISIQIVKKVVEKVEDPKKELSLSEAKLLDEEAALGDELLIEEYSDEFRRTAIQNAKQIIIQKVREAERNKVADHFANKVGKIITGKIRRIDEMGNFFIDCEGVEVMLGTKEQSPNDHYIAGENIKFLVQDVYLTYKFPKILITRKRPEFVEALFAFEVPEVSQGIIKIKSIVREAGFRTKVAVYSDSEAIDVLGACVGTRSSRIRAVMNELGGEKIDIILWDENPQQFLINSIQPAQVNGIEVNEENKSAVLKVKEEQLALAIGKNGQNIRLASKLTGFNISIDKIGV